MFKLSNKSKKVMKALSLGIISLGLLTGVGISFNNNIHADDIPGEISNKYLEPASQIESDSDKTKAGEIYTGIQQCKKYPQIAASAAAGSGKYIFQQYKNQILPYYDKAQMKEFIYDYDNNEINDDTTIDSKGNIHSLKSTHHVMIFHHHARKHDKNLVRNKRDKRAFRRTRKARKYSYKRAKVVKNSVRRYVRPSKNNKSKLTEKQLKHFRSLIRKDKRALKSKKAKRNYKYYRFLLKNIKSLKRFLILKK